MIHRTFNPNSTTSSQSAAINMPPTSKQQFLTVSTDNNRKSWHSAQFVHLSATFMLVLSALLLQLCLPATVLALDSTSLDNTAPALPPPHAAALASPGPAPGSSSILEQFSPNCTAVSHIFQARGIDSADIPQKPSRNPEMRYCESPSVGTCCTYGMETKMATQSRTQLERHSKEQIIKMSSILAAKAQRFNDIFRKLLLNSKEDFHLMFTRTYGIIYQQNSYVFSDLFTELENYYAKGRNDLTAVMNNFFNVLYQKMFQVLNSQYDFDEKYLRCVSEHMKELKPFGDVPEKLSLQIKRSFVATRTYGHALSAAADVAKKLVNVRLNSDCTNALTKMQHCGACKGYSEKPCTNYCINVIKGCLHHFNELDMEWENFAMSIDKLADRLLGSFNIVMVVDPLNIKISEAIMNFQDSGIDITNRVFQGCGRPQLRRTTRSISPKFSNTASSLLSSSMEVAAVKTKASLKKHLVSDAQDFSSEVDILDIDANLDDALVLREKRAADPARGESGESNSGSSRGQGNRRQQQQQQQGRRNKEQQQQQQQNRKKEQDQDYSGNDPILDKLVRDIRQRVKEYKKFWSNLPTQMCSNETISSSSDVDGMCWNGHTIDRYMHSITTENGKNPEFPSNPSTVRQTSTVATQVHYLKNAINHLRNAYNGLDVEWSDPEESYYGSGGGSGDGDEDDEDDEDEEGSGMDPMHKPENGDHSQNKGNGIDNDDEDIAPPNSGGRGRDGSSSIPAYTTRPDNSPNSVEEDEEEITEHDNDIELSGSGQSGGPSTKAPTMSLRRALMLYLLPLYMAWFGGIFAEWL